MKQSIAEIITFLKPEFVHGDARGKLRQLVSSGWNQVNFINSSPGSIRGGHHHKNNREMFFVISGKFRLTLSGHGQTASFVMEPEDLFIIEKNISHSFEFLEETLLISLYDKGVIEKTDGKTNMDMYQDA